jgi:tryptophan-rich sensory protein
MKNALYVIAGLLAIIWAIVFFGFNSFAFVHIILILAVFLILVQIIFGKKLFKK